MMSVSIDEVRRIARLARLSFTEDEEQRLAEEMSRILDYMETLRQVDVSAVPPMSHVLDLMNVTRDDVVAPRVTRDEGLENAPDTDHTFFRVPRVIE